MISRRLAAAGVLALWGVVAAEQPRFSIEDVTAAPFAHELTVGGSTIAWVHNTRGVRNLWVATGPEFTGRQLTQYTRDDGQELGDVTVTPDGRTVFYVRGGDANRRGEIPNPTSDPAGQEQVLWKIAVSGGASERVGNGNSPLISPKGDRVVFNSGGQVWCVPLDGSIPAKPLFRMRGTAGEVTWSPDGSRLAFVSARGDHAFIGVYEFATQRIRWMAPGFDRDRGPAWSPDGTRLAFVRIPAGFTPPLFGPVRHGPPWSLWIADVATGDARRIWTAAVGDGSVFRRISGGAVLWAAGERLVFNWERDGWSHLYAIGTWGGEPLLLTPGRGEVGGMVLSHDGRSVIYSTNIGPGPDDIDRLDLYQVGVAGGTPVPLQRTPGLEWSPRPLEEGKTIAFLRSDARIPAHAALLAQGRVRVLAPDALPADFPARRLVQPAQVLFQAADGIGLHGQLFVPPDVRPGEKRPAIVFLHGGSRRQMLLGFHNMGYYNLTYAMNQWLVSRGYVVLSVNYRSGTGYGMKFREAERYGPTGASEYQDVVAAGAHLKSRPDVDGARIGLWGGSYGGYLTAMGLARSSGLFAAGVDLHGVHDWNSGIRNFIPDYKPLENPEASKLAFDSSPLKFVDGWRSPVLLIHGDDDRNVNFNESIRLIAALRERGLEPEQLALPDEVHDFLTHANWLRVFHAMGDFFERRLPPGVRP